MNRCKTCQHWRYPVDVHGNLMRYDHVIDPKDFDTGEVMDTGFRVLKCHSPKLLMIERPADRDFASVVDASDYMATLYTGEDFGCVNHEAKEKA